METVWKDLFSIPIPVWEKILRAAAVYVFLIVGLRLSGKRELAQLNPFDLVVLLTLSNTVQNAIIGDDNSLLGGLIGAAALMFINYMTVRFMFHHPRLERLVEGSPVAMIKHGKLQKGCLRRELISTAELQAAARRQGFESLREIDEAILEPGGTITFLRKEPSPEKAHYQEILNRLDRISTELRSLGGTEGPLL
jgi:uncharacterized membrane protein YcaP (DUF421 family)